MTQRFADDTAYIARRMKALGLNRDEPFKCVEAAPSQVGDYEASDTPALSKPVCEYCYMVAPLSRVSLANYAVHVCSSNCRDGLRAGAREGWDKAGQPNPYRRHTIMWNLFEAGAKAAQSGVVRP